MRLLALLLVACNALAADFAAFGSVPDGVTNNTPQFNAAVAALCASNDRTLRLGVGQFAFHSAPAAISCALNIVGEGNATSPPAIQQAQQPGGDIHAFVPGGVALTRLLRWGVSDVFLFVLADGSSIRNLAIDAMKGNGGIAILSYGHSLVLDNVTIEARFNMANIGVLPTGSWAYGVYLYQAHSSVLRDVTVRHFTQYPFLLHTSNAAKITQAECRDAQPGAVAAISLYLSTATSFSHCAVQP